MLDDANNVIVASCTHSNYFPVVNAIQDANGGNQDGTVFKLSAASFAVLADISKTTTSKELSNSLRIFFTLWTGSFLSISFITFFKNNNVF